MHSNLIGRHSCLSMDGDYLFIPSLSSDFAERYMDLPRNHCPHLALSQGAASKLGLPLSTLDSKIQSLKLNNEHLKSSCFQTQLPNTALRFHDISEISDDSRALRDR